MEMTMGDIPDSLDELRRLAEGRAQGLDAMVDTSDHDLSDAGMRAVHELRVHKIELEMQNEQLRSVRDALEIARDS